LYSDIFSAAADIIVRQIYFNLIVIGRKLDSVREQVNQHLLDPHTVDNHISIQKVVRKFNLDAFQLGLPSQNIDSVRTKFNHVFFLHLGFKMVVGQQTVVQHHFDLGKQKLCSACDHRSLLLQSLIL
jgi:hypothetical protein